MNTLVYSRAASIALVTFALLIAVFLSARAQAQTPAPTQTRRIAILDVADGGTDELADAVAQLDGVTVERQAWFLEQIQARGFSPKGIMTRPDDLKWLMQGAQLDYILFLAGDENNDQVYIARLVGSEKGEPVLQFSADRTSSGLSPSGAKLTAQEIKKYLDSQKPRDLEAEERARRQAEAEAAERAKAADPNQVKLEAEAARQAAMTSFSKGWLALSVRGILLRRDLHAAGENQAVLAYTSAFYPGFALGVEAFPLGMSNQEMAGIGFYLDYVQGFDSATVLDADSNEASISLFHTEIEGGVLYQLGDPLAVKSSDEAKLNLSIGVRYTGLSAEANPSLPSLSYASFVIGSRVSRKMFADNVQLRAGVNVVPLAIYGTGAELFGESSYSSAVGGNLGMLIQASDEIGITAGYEFRLQRTGFTGDGVLGFTSASVFELVQGLSAGLLYRY